mmetsp:Transcript_2962/g.6717  ORF Transcript_2962/g.6717 Transcript_2962/m.6717 type:complete len:220 (-) Transcript_2962:514-1173(-)
MRVPSPSPPSAMDTVMQWRIESACLVRRLVLRFSTGSTDPAGSDHSSSPSGLSSDRMVDRAATGSFRSCTTSKQKAASKECRPWKKTCCGWLGRPSIVDWTKSRLVKCGGAALRARSIDTASGSSPTKVVRGYRRASSMVDSPEPTPMSRKRMPLVILSCSEGWFANQLGIWCTNRGTCMRWMPCDTSGPRAEKGTPPPSRKHRITSGMLRNEPRVNSK